MAIDKHPEQEPVRLVDSRDQTVLDTDLDLAERKADYKEEAAAEFHTAEPISFSNDDRNTDEPVEQIMNGRAMGIFSLVLSILSLFILPILLGAAGIIVGFVARKGSSKTIGNWAIGIGVVSILTSLFFSAFI
ncbi:DUF4190 domain-containing protein [Alkalihalobacillus sp. FSL R5-0424]